MQRFNKAVALLLCMVMLIGFVPVSALAADAAGNPTIVIAGSDYQASNSGTTMTNIGTQIKTLQPKGLSRVFSNTTVQKHQFFGAQPSL